MWQPGEVPTPRKSPPRSTVRTALRAASLVGLAGAAGLGYSAGVEVRWFALRRQTLPVLPAGHRPLKVLHVSDLHLTPSQGRKRAWVRGLADLEPDLVVNTGDNLAHQQAVPALLDAFGPLLDVPGVFVLGSNDYFAPSLRNPVRYLLPDDGQRNTGADRLPSARLKAELTDRGWRDLSNRRDALTVGQTRFAFAGVDDPHLEYDDLAAVAGTGRRHGRRPDGRDPRAVPPGAGPVRRRRLRDGDGRAHARRAAVPALSRRPGDQLRPRHRPRQRAAPAPGARPGGRPGSSWLHVSAGLGTSPYAPVRFCCRPEATLLTLTPVHR